MKEWNLLKRLQHFNTHIHRHVYIQTKFIVVVNIYYFINSKETPSFDLLVMGFIISRHMELVLRACLVLFTFALNH